MSFYSFDKFTVSTPKCHCC